MGWVGDGWISTPPWPLGTQGQQTSRTTAPFFPRAQARQADGHHHRSCVSAAVVVCDIRPAVFCLRPAVAPEAKRQLRGASSMEEAETGLPRIVCLWGRAPAMTATGTHCGSSGLWSSPG